MKRVLLLSICIVASSALVAMADANSGNYPSWLTAVRTMNVSPGYDRIDYTLNTNGFPTGVSLGVLEGTWSSADGKIALNKTTNATTWRDATGSAGGMNPSGVNLPPNTASGVFSRTGASNGTYFLASSFKGGWFTSDANGVLNPDGMGPVDPEDPNSPYPLSNVLGTMLVTTGRMVNFVGNVGWLGTGPLGGQAPAIAFGSVPEPGTLVLLATALIGFAMWVRRRA